MMTLDIHVGLIGGQYVEKVLNNTFSPGPRGREHWHLFEVQASPPRQVLL